MNDVSLTPTTGSTPAAPAGRAAGEVSARRDAPAGRPVFRPRVDLLDRQREVVLTADMPGSRAEDIEIHFENGQLTVRGRVADRPSPHADTGADGDVRHLLREYRLGDFERSFTLGEQIDTDGIEAGFAAGVLTVRLPKLGRAQPRRIEVRAG